VLGGTRCKGGQRQARPGLTGLRAQRPAAPAQRPARRHTSAHVLFDRWRLGSCPSSCSCSDARPLAGVLRDQAQAAAAEQRPGAACRVDRMAKQAGPVLPGTPAGPAPRSKGFCRIHSGPAAEVRCDNLNRSFPCVAPAHLLLEGIPGTGRGPRVPGCTRPTCSRSDPLCKPRPAAALLPPLMPGPAAPRCSEWQTCLGSCPAANGRISIRLGARRRPCARPGAAWWRRPSGPSAGAAWWRSRRSSSGNVARKGGVEGAVCGGVTRLDYLSVVSAAGAGRARD
jgi:hypothetical protein